MNAGACHVFRFPSLSLVLHGCLRLCHDRFLDMYMRTRARYVFFRGGSVTPSRTTRKRGYWRGEEKKQEKKYITYVSANVPCFHLIDSEHEPIGISRKQMTNIYMCVCVCSALQPDGYSLSWRGTTFAAVNQASEPARRLTVGLEVRPDGDNSRTD